MKGGGWLMGDARRLALMQRAANVFGLVGGLFYGLSFGLGGVAAAGIGLLADKIGIIEVFKICAWLPAFGLLTFLLPKSGRQS